MKSVKNEIANVIRNKVSTSRYNIFNFDVIPSIELGYPSFLKLIIGVSDSIEKSIGNLVANRVRKRVRK